MAAVIIDNLERDHEFVITDTTLTILHHKYALIMYNVAENSQNRYNNNDFTPTKNLQRIFNTLTLII